MGGGTRSPAASSSSSVIVPRQRWSCRRRHLANNVFVAAFGAISIPLSAVLLPLLRTTHNVVASYPPIVGAAASTFSLPSSLPLPLPAAPALALAPAAPVRAPSSRRRAAAFDDFSASTAFFGGTSFAAREEVLPVTRRFGVIIERTATTASTAATASMAPRRRSGRVAAAALNAAAAASEEGTPTVEEGAEEEQSAPSEEEVEDISSKKKKKKKPTKAKPKTAATTSKSKAKAAASTKKGGGGIGSKKKAGRAAAAGAEKKEATEDDSSSDGKEEEEKEGTGGGAKEKQKKDASEKPAAQKKKAAAARKKKGDGDGGNTSDETGGDDDDDGPPKKKAKKKKAPPHQVLTDRDVLPKLWTDDDAKKAGGSYTFKVASWNVAGLRALVKKAPNALAELVSRHDLDVLCLQETKLQEVHLDDPKLVPKSSGGGGKGGKGDSAAGAPAATIRNLLDGCGYDAHFSCSTAKKGYSGTAVFIRRRGNGGSGGKQKTIDKFFFANKAGDGDDKEDKKEKKAETLPIDPNLLVPESISFGMGVEKHDAEGRIVVMDFPLFTMCNVYVPNSGQNLDRLDYRTEEWDRDWVDFIRRKSAERKVPAMWVGDLNVAHTNLEVWNDGAKHLPKQAGVTPQERASFQRQLDAGFVDAFRHLHPDAKGHYSYWSQRAGNREPNKGLRLDYFVGDPSFFDVDGEAKVVARDCYMDPDQEGSDHCPVLLELEIRK